MSKSDNTHEASASAVGYLYQCRYALLAGLRAIPQRPQLSISIERFDDVAFDVRGEATELIQTKHHLGKAGGLSDASVDLWKTLRIWSTWVARDLNAPFRVSFYLLTTAIAPVNSAASYLCATDRDETKADELLMGAITSSKSKENKPAYDAYSALPKSQRINLLRAVTVLDRSPNIIDVRDEIVREVYHAAPRDKLEQLTQRLEGWWFGVVIGALAGTGPSSIPVMSIDQRVDELREEFKRDALPVDFSTATPPAAVVADLDKRPFVRQLRMINIGPIRVEYAIRDYYRASEQRSRWAREELLVDGELEQYERDLVEAWEPRHAANLDELTPTCSTTKRIQLGQALFKWAEQEASYPLRSVRERFLTHGSFHILANRYVLGWHPDYKSDASPSE